MLAIIPAREGSKGLPNKNIKELHGYPMIAYTIQAALDSKDITRVIVSTDSNKIADISKMYGAEVPFLRASNLAKDDSHILDNYIYVLEQLYKNEGTEYTEFVALQPTSPFRTVEDIDNAIEIFHNKNVDSVISMTQEHHPIVWSRYINNDGRFYSVLPEVIDNRQVYQPSYFFNGAVYVYRSSLVKRREMYTDNSVSYVMPRDRSIDIDTIDDFDYAEYMLNENRIKLPQPKLVK